MLVEDLFLLKRRSSFYNPLQGDGVKYEQAKYPLGN